METNPDPVSDSSSHSKRHAAAKIACILLLLLAVAVASVAIVAYLSERSRLTGLDQQNQELQAEVQQLKNAANAKQPSTPPVQPTTTYKSQKGVSVAVYAPQSGATVAVGSLGVIGMVPGTWSFEASFPVQLKDGNGAIVAEAPAQIQGNWMTEADVPFAVTLLINKKPTTASGTLVLQKNNASGLAEHDDSVSIPVKFQ